jgi:hypothetical protein
MTRCGLGSVAVPPFDSNDGGNSVLRFVLGTAFVVMIPLGVLDTVWRRWAGDVLPAYCGGADKTVVGSCAWGK